ncbi:unnamed protein product [Cercopithifilaria johnstoni]|uniref:Uncharacterized protein n=1 Tax=Cercopithifilaria johnstoni TaxID=2874296 RepID=A0A8J2LW98_9BILA|nr:unnamed protein product [Cercopithifilaria johnstoni]
MDRPEMCSISLESTWSYWIKIQQIGFDTSVAFEDSTIHFLIRIYSTDEKRYFAAFEEPKLLTGDIYHQIRQNDSTQKLKFYDITAA